MVWAQWSLVVVQVVLEHEMLLGLFEEIHFVEITEILHIYGIEGRDHIVGVVERILLELVKPCIVKKGSLFVEV